jgi:HAD superfamily hydrolase (TIGR01484 family)
MVHVKGWICLDIDGTITSDPYSIPKGVIDYFIKLQSEGWHFLFTTGRTFTFAEKLLRIIPFPYLFSVQNGADLIEMPERKRVKRSYLPVNTIDKLDQIYNGQAQDYIVYAGMDVGDFCYFCSDHFSSTMKEHLEILMSLVKEPWKNVDSFSVLKNKHFPLIKCLGTKEQMQELGRRLVSTSDLHVTMIKDPLSNNGYYNNLITSKEASKGEAVEWLRNTAGDDVVFIGAGDDFNDLSLLQAVDIAISMITAPAEVRAYADIIAPPAEDLGIIQALEQAIQMQGY